MTIVTDLAPDFLSFSLWTTMRKLPPKERGELAEIEFLRAAANRGLTVAKPWGDSKPFDFLAGRDGRRYLRVQVKATASLNAPGRWAVNVRRPCRRTPYTAKEVDIIAVYAVPEEKWWIIPIRAIGQVSGLSVSSSKRSKGRFDRYLGRWDLLGQ